MTTFIGGFDNFDDMLAFMAENERVANTKIDDTQRAITYGQHWVRFYDIPGRILIFGRVMPLAEIEANETRLGAEPAEVHAVLESTKDMHERGYVWGYAYSVIEVAGELGNTHRSEIVPCPEEVFNEAKAVGWNVDHLQPEWKARVEELYQQWRRHLGAIA